MKVLLFTFLAIAPVHAGSRNSADYNITTDTNDAAGRRADGASYSNDGSLGGIGGVSNLADPAETVKHSYIGQLYESAGLMLTSAAPAVDETTSVQLAAWLVLEDATLLAVPPANVGWSGQAPISVSISGLATAATVYENITITVVGEHAGFTAALLLGVVNSLPDNFGIYADDSVDDDWQVLHFGLDNPDAKGRFDPDGDGQSNLFEFIAGLVPTDPLSRFLVRIEPDASQPTRKHIIFSPLVAGRTYTVNYHMSLLSGPWLPLKSPTQSDNGDERTVVDENAMEPKKFYRVHVTKP